MSDLKIEVFTSKRCPHCPHAVAATKKLLKENPILKDRIRWDEVSTSTPNGSRKAKRYGIMSVPTIILTNKQGDVRGIKGIPSQSEYLKYVYLMLGEESPKTEDEQGKNGFFNRLF